MLMLADVLGTITDVGSDTELFLQWHPRQVFTTRNYQVDEAITGDTPVLPGLSYHFMSAEDAAEFLDLIVARALAITWSLHILRPLRHQRALSNRDQDRLDQQQILLERALHTCTDEICAAVPFLLRQDQEE